MDESSTLSSIECVIAVLNDIIPEICNQDSIKEKLVGHINGLKIHLIGCEGHTEEIDRKIRNLAADHVILTFCNDISKILSGKTTVLPEKPNLIQKIAFGEWRKKKRIGKYTDKFNQ